MTDFSGHRPIPFWVWWRGWLLQGREGFLLSRRSDEFLIHAHGHLWGWHSLLTGMHWPKSQPCNTVWQCLREKGAKTVRWLWVSLVIVLGFILGRKGRVRSWMEQLPKNKWNHRKKLSHVALGPSAYPNIHWTKHTAEHNVTWKTPECCSAWGSQVQREKCLFKE